MRIEKEEEGVQQKVSVPLPKMEEGLSSAVLSQNEGGNQGNGN